MIDGGKEIEGGREGEGEGNGESGGGGPRYYHQRPELAGLGAKRTQVGR